MRIRPLQGTEFKGVNRSCRRKKSYVGQFSPCSYPERLECLSFFACQSPPHTVLRSVSIEDELMLIVSIRRNEKVLRFCKLLPQWDE